MDKAAKDIEDLTEKLKKEEQAQSKEQKKMEEEELIEKKKTEEQQRIEMFEKIMNSQKSVSAEEVERFKDIYGKDYDDEEMAAVLLLNKENFSQNTQEVENAE